MKLHAVGSTADTTLNNRPQHLFPPSCFLSEYRFCSGIYHIPHWDIFQGAQPLFLSKALSPTLAIVHGLGMEKFWPLRHKKKCSGGLWENFYCFSERYAGRESPFLLGTLSCMDLMPGMPQPLCDHEGNYSVRVAEQTDGVTKVCVGQVGLPCP